MNFWYNAVKKF